MAELADALDSGSSESNFIWVQVPLSAPDWINPNQKGSDLSFFVLYNSRRVRYITVILVILLNKIH